MKTIGLIGGMSWESSLHYYKLINQGVSERLGGLHSAKLLMYSVDFDPIEKMQRDGRWDDAGEVLADAAAALERGGADFVVLCTNTMHRVASQIEARVRIPLLHIADATARAIKAGAIRRVGLLGTRFTMEQPFYRDRLSERHGLEVIVPPEIDRELVHRVIYDELCLGRVESTSRDDYRRIAAELVDAGAEGVILGCTEIMMLLSQDDVTVPVFDTTAIHAAAAVELANAGRSTSSARRPSGP
jgi:aspartate racemase